MTELLKLLQTPPDAADLFARWIVRESWGRARLTMTGGLALLTHVSESEARNLGNAICGELERRGHRVLRFSTVEGETGVENLIVELDVMGDPDLPWVKAFGPAVRTASVGEVEAQLSAWKHGVRDDLTLGRASDVVKAAVAHYGLDRVRAMLGVQ